ncbi:hypothetical protein [Streptomyces sclerotialus]|uniref:hypothetical protein n=1 Tax=Streptomyces sclerotialus TaxID=1957 RepID=UPI0004C91203
MRARLSYATVAVSIAAAALAGNVATPGDAEAAGHGAADVQRDPCELQDVHVLDIPVKAVNGVCRIKRHAAEDLTGVVA